MSPLIKIIIGLILCFLAGLATGYFSLPQKVVTKVEVREKIVTVTEKSQANDVVTIRREIDKPDGTKVIRVVTVDKSVFKEEEKKDETIDRTETKTVTRDTPQWQVRAIAGVDLKSKLPVYGGGIERRILGPIFIGAFAMSNGTAGASIAILF